jgi:hypothetical protein
MMATDDLGAVVARLDAAGVKVRLQNDPKHPCQQYRWWAAVTVQRDEGRWAVDEYGRTPTEALTAAADRAGVPAAEAEGRAG